jgi:predicted nucleic acid-binding protein
VRVVADTNVLVSGFLPVLRCAVGGQAQAIVTGDKDLLTLREFHGILIVTPRIFLTTIGL